MIVGMLSILGTYIFFQKENKVINDLKITIPEIVIPSKSIDFTIEKKSTGIISFSGNFSKEEAPKKIFTLISNEKIVDNIIVNSNLEYNNKVLTLVYKLLPIIKNNYTIWLIRYDKRKLLIEGNTKTVKSKEQVDSILAYSTVNSFNNTKINMKLDVVSELNEFESLPKKDNDLSEDDVESIISSLQKVVLIEKDPDNQDSLKKDLKIVKKELQIVKNDLNIVKKVIKGVRTELNVIKKDDKKKNEIKYAQDVLSENIVDEDIMSLPMVKTVDMDIEDKIDKGILSPLRTKKPLVEEESILVESSEYQINESIPWAKLHDLDEDLEGIISDEIVASPVGL